MKRWSDSPARSYRFSRESELLPPAGRVACRFPHQPHPRDIGHAKASVPLRAGLAADLVQPAGVVNVVAAARIPSKKEARRPVHAEACWSSYGDVRFWTLAQHPERNPIGVKLLFRASAATALPPSLRSRISDALQALFQCFPLFAMCFLHGGTAAPGAMGLEAPPDSSQEQASSPQRSPGSIVFLIHGEGIH